MAFQLIGGANSYFAIINNVSETDIDGNATLINDASVQFTLLDDDGEEVAGQVWPTSAVNTPTIAEPDGRYVGPIDSTAVIEPGRNYFCRVIISTPRNSGFTETYCGSAVVSAEPCEVC